MQELLTNRPLKMSWSVGVWRATVFCLLLLALLPLRCLAASLTATLDRDTTTVGESVTLSLVFEGGEPDTPPAVPTVQNLMIRYAGQSSQYSVVNGRMSSSLTHSYVVTPAQPGDFVLPPIQTVVKGQTLRTQPLKLKVVRSDAGEANQGGVGNLAVLKLVLPKTNVYVGEVFPVEIRLYFQNAQNIHIPQLKADGFTVGQMPKPAQTQTQVGNAVYNLAVFKMTATAAREGTLQLGPAECNLEVIVPLANRRRRDPFDSFFNDPFGFAGPRGQARPVTLPSEAQTITVQPLPKESVPADFAGAVGSYSLAVTASPTNVAVGDPITITARITGEGQLDSLVLPALANWRDFKVYPPSTKVETSDALGIQGVKTFEQVVVPETPQVRQLPAITFSFFDPVKKGYRTLRHEPTTIAVRPTPSGPAQPTVLAMPAQSREAPRKDIVHIKARPGSLGMIRPPLVQQNWFLLLQAVPLLLWLAALTWRKRSDSLAHNPRLRRRLQVSRTIRTGLAELRHYAATNQKEESFVTVFRLLQEQLGERLDLPAASITEAVIEDQLRPRGAPAPLLEDLRALFHTCNQARYAPQSNPEELTALVPKVEAALAALRKLELGQQPPGKPVA